MMSGDSFSTWDSDLGSGNGHMGTGNYSIYTYNSYTIKNSYKLIYVYMELLTSSTKIIDQLTNQRSLERNPVVKKKNRLVKVVIFWPLRA